MSFDKNSNRESQDRSPNFKKTERMIIIDVREGEPFNDYNLKLDPDVVEAIIQDKVRGIKGG